jgi:hypothetical protein
MDTASEPLYKSEVFREPRLILCEGESDCAFFRSLLEGRRIPGFQVVKPAGGKDGFKDRLDAFPAITGFEDVLLIVLVRDNDDDPARSFKHLQTQIREADGYKAPGRRLELAKGVNGVFVTIMMLPWLRQPGNLETIILRAISDKWKNLRVCLKDYLKCSPARQWTKSKKDKMLLQCMIAATCKDDPNCSQSYMWQKKKGFQPLLGNPCFDQIESFLIKLKGHPRLQPSPTPSLPFSSDTQLP